MSNVLTALEPILFSAAQEVSNEPFGAVDAINVQFNDQGVARGDKVKVTVAPTRAAADFTPSNITTTGTAATAEAVDVEITKSRKVSFHLSGEQQRSLDNGATSAEWVRQLIAQAMRTLRNEAEADCVKAIHFGASRATGSAGTGPFASNLNTLVDVRKILHDNGAPMSDLQFVMDTSAGAAIRKLGIFASAEQAGTAEERRSGNFLRQYGFQLRESAGIVLHTAGTAANYVTDGAQLAQSRAIEVKTGTGTLVQGDVVTIGGLQYVVNSGLAAPGEFTINRPGLRAQIADAQAVTRAGNFTPLLAFERDSVVGIMRPPLFPANPTIQTTLISDSLGMTYMLADIAQYGQRTWELHLAWGFKAVQPEHIALLLS